jgi:hypothetical protein
MAARPLADVGGVASPRGGEGGAARAAGAGAATPPPGSRGDRGGASGSPQIALHRASSAGGSAGGGGSSEGGEGAEEGAAAAVAARLRGFVARRAPWAGLVAGMVREAEYGSSPLQQSGRAGVTTDMGSPAPAAGSVGGGSGSRGGGATPRGSPLAARGAGAGAAVSPIEATMRLGAAVVSRGGSGRGGGGGRGGGSGGGGGRVPLPFFQSFMAQQGLALTPRELHALSVKYGNGGGEPPHWVDLAALGRDMA